MKELVLDLKNKELPPKKEIKNQAESKNEAEAVNYSEGNQEKSELAKLINAKEKMTRAAPRTFKELAERYKQVF